MASIVIGGVEVSYNSVIEMTTAQHGLFSGVLKDYNEEHGLGWLAWFSLLDKLELELHQDVFLNGCLYQVQGIRSSVYGVEYGLRSVVLTGERDAPPVSVRTKHNHYHKDVSKLSYIDVYRVLCLFAVTDPCIQHAVKKLLVAGGRGAGKDISKDISEAIDSLVRWQEMRKEETE